MELLWVLLGLIAMGVLFFYPILQTISTHIYADDAFKNPGNSDAYLFLWSFWSGDNSLKNHLPFFETGTIYPPYGANLFFHTMLPFHSFIMYPITRLFGIVASFNVMVFMLMLLACFVYYLFLRINYQFKPEVCFITSILFGFSPYFITKMSGHIDMINASIWGAALLILLTAYLKNRFKWYYGVLFAFFFWLMLYVSLIEFFILFISSIIIIVSFELYYLLKEKKISQLKEKVIFFIPLVLGVSALFNLMRYAPSFEVANLGLYKGFYFRDFFNFPRYNLPGSLTHWVKGDSEYWGIYYTYTAVILLITGIFFWRKEKKDPNIILLIISLLTFLIIWDKYDSMSSIIRLIPFSKGFRVFARFWPVLLFVSLPFVAFSMNKIFTLKNRTVRFLLSGLVVLFLFIEIYPFNLKPMPVKNLELTKNESSTIDKTKYVLVFPVKEFKSIYDTYQATSGLKMVYFDTLSRENYRDRAKREAFAPMIYHYNNPLENTIEYSKELSNLNIGYIIFENKNDRRRGLFNGRIIAERNPDMLIELTNYRINSESLSKKNN